MDSVEQALKSALRELILSKPYKKISIGDICAEANVSKATLYKKYASKDALLVQILLDDICEPITATRCTIPTASFRNEAHSIIDFVQFSNILDNAEFYRRVVKESPVLFFYELTKALAEINRGLLSAYDIDPVEKDFMAFHFAANHTLLIAKWIHEDMSVDPRELAAWYYKWATVNWENLAQTWPPAPDASDQRAFSG